MQMQIIFQNLLVSRALLSFLRRQWALHFVAYGAILKRRLLFASRPLCPDVPFLPFISHSHIPAFCPTTRVMLSLRVVSPLSLFH